MSQAHRYILMFPCTLHADRAGASGPRMPAKPAASVLLTLFISFVLLSALSHQSAAVSACSGPAPSIANVFNTVDVSALQPSTLTGGSTQVSIYASVNGINNYCQEVQTGYDVGTNTCQYGPSCYFWVYQCPDSAQMSNIQGGWPYTNGPSELAGTCGYENGQCQPGVASSCGPGHGLGPFDCAATGWVTDNMINGAGIINKGPGIYNLCYTIVVADISGAGTTGACNGDAAQCYWTYNGETTSIPSSFVSSPDTPGTAVTNAILANALYGGSGADGNVVYGPYYVPVYNMLSPLQVNTINTGANTYSISAVGTAITCSGCSTGSYQTSLQNPTNIYLELSSPDSVSGALFSSQYCVDPGIIPACPTYTVAVRRSSQIMADPTTANLPCLLGSAGYTTLSSTDPVAVSAELDSSRLSPNNYEVCAYENVPPYNPAVQGDGITSPETDNGMFWGFTFFTTGSCNGYNPFCSTSTGTPAGFNSIQNTACSLYLYVSESLFVLALVIMLIGAVLYAGASLLPGQARGQAQAYGMGLVIAGVASAVITVVSIYFLTVGTGLSVGQILTLNSCSGAGL